MKYKNKKLINTVIFLSAFALVLLPNFVAFADEADGEFGTPTPVPTEQTTQAPPEGTPSLSPEASPTQEPESEKRIT